MRLHNNIELAQMLHDYAEDHYNEGWDHYVECGMEYCVEFVGNLESWEAVFEMAEQINSVLDDQRAEANYQIKAGG